jgi:hypothetical protein
MEKSEAYLEIAEKSWQEMKVKHLNIKCPKCGGEPDEIPPFGQKIKCPYCFPPTFYVINEAVNEASIKQIINGVLEKYHTTFSRQEFDNLAAQISKNHASIISEMKTAFQAQNKVSAEYWQKNLDANIRIEDHLGVVERKVEGSHIDLKDTVQQAGRTLERKIDRLAEEIQNNPSLRAGEVIGNLPRQNPPKKITQRPPDYDDDSY